MDGEGEGQTEGQAPAASEASDVAAPPPTEVIDPTPQHTLSSEKDVPKGNGSTDALPPPGATAPVVSTPKTEAFPPIMPHPHTFHRPPSRGKQGNHHFPPLSLNQLAIVAASQNKLPTSRVKGIVARMGRHTQSSAKKLGRWYKGDNYVDNSNYSWRNMELFVDYQKQMYTANGTIKATCKK